MFRLGLPEMAIIFAVFIFIFGPKKLPEIGKSLGQTIKNFKWSLKQLDPDEEENGKEKDNSPRAS